MDFHKIKKYCEFCGEELLLRNNRDIARKRFCSRSCLCRWMRRNGVLNSPKYHSEETKLRMRELKQKLLKTGWEPVGWRKYDTKERLSGRGYYFKGTERVHRLVAQKAIGRKLRQGEVVHHINGNKLDNDVSNLQVMEESEHLRLHSRLRKGVYYATII